MAKTTNKTSPALQIIELSEGDLEAIAGGNWFTKLTGITIPTPNITGGWFKKLTGMLTP
jgi:hypothetical protein